MCIVYESPQHTTTRPPYRPRKNLPMPLSPAANLRFLLNYILRSAAAIDEQDFSRRPASGLNPPVWLLGHLAVSIDGVSKYIGESYALPIAWHENFKGGSVARRARWRSRIGDVVCLIPRVSGGMVRSGGGRSVCAPGVEW